MKRNPTKAASQRAKKRWSDSKPKRTTPITFIFDDLDDGQQFSVRARQGNKSVGLLLV
jgi:hypothetical protein